MSNVARVRVEIRQHSHNPSYEDREIAFKKMFHAFKKACSEAGVMRSYRQHESYESKSRKKRRKLRESEIARLKNQLKENFVQGK